MDLRHLEYYIAVYDCRNLTTAASGLMLSQQGLSKTIQKLETEFNTPLFIRTRSGLIPTEFGTVLYEEAQKILAQYKASMNILTIAREKKRPLKIGCTAEIYHTLHLSEAFAEFLPQNPDIQIITETDTSSACEKKVLTGDLDIAFAEGPFEDTKFKSLLLISAKYYVLLSPGHPLSERRKLFLKDLAGQSLIIADGSSKGANNSLKLLEQLKVPYQITYRGVDVNLHSSLVRKQLGIALFPEHVLPEYEKEPGLHIIEVVDMPVRELFMLYNHADRDPAGIRFIEWMRKRVV